jgi:uncharacterized protein
MSSIYPKATIFDTEVRHITSSSNGQDYAISVWFPPGYSTSTKTYPVLYMTDGDTFFGLVSHLATGLIWSQQLPEIIIVGVGYDMQSYEDWGFRRNSDLCPTVVEDVPNSGGADKFLDFFQSELIPFVNKNYRTEPNDKALGGYSFGGLFTLYALLHASEVFNRYLAGSPSVGYDKKLLFEQEKEFFKNHSSLPVKLFVSVGSNEGEMVTDIQAFTEILKQRNYEGIELTFLVIEGETHLNAGAQAWLNGLRKIYS